MRELSLLCQHHSSTRHKIAKPTFGEKFIVIGLGLIGLLTVQLLLAQGCSYWIDNDLTKCKFEKLGINAFHDKEGIMQQKYYLVNLNMLDLMEYYCRFDDIK